MKINWRQKLSSRKFWALVAALAVSLLTAFGAGAEITERITGVIGAIGSCVIYMLAEAIVDSNRKE